MECTYKNKIFRVKFKMKFICLYIRTYLGHREKLITIINVEQNFIWEYQNIKHAKKIGNNRIS